jgi:hypothetical protein
MRSITEIKQAIIAKIDDAEFSGKPIFRSALVDEMIEEGETPSDVEAAIAQLEFELTEGATGLVRRRARRSPPPA